MKDNSGYMLQPTTYENFNITGQNSTNATIGIRLSDKWGHHVNNLTSTGFTKGSVIQLYNYNSWTEGTVIENCMFRYPLSGISVTRGADKPSNTNSFYQTKIRNVAVAMGDAGAALRLVGTQDLPIMAYEWNIENLTGWYEHGGTRLIEIGNYATLSGHAILSVDGFGGFSDGTDCPVIRCRNNGKGRLEGTILGSQNTSGNNQSLQMYQLINQETNWQYSQSQPLLKFKGAKILLTIPLTTDMTEDTILYNAGKLSPFSTYRLTIKGEFNNTTASGQYLITTTTFTQSAKITCLDATETTGLNTRLKPVNYFDHWNQQYDSSSNGSILRIKLVSAITKNGNISIELEEL